MAMIEDPELRDYFESLVFKRFESQEEIKNHLQSKFKDSTISVCKKDRIDSGLIVNDFEIMVEIKSDTYLYDLDIYYLRDNLDKYFITEVGYEVE